MDVAAEHNKAGLCEPCPLICILLFFKKFSLFFFLSNEAVETFPRHKCVFGKDRHRNVFTTATRKVITSEHPRLVPLLYVTKSGIVPRQLPNSQPISCQQFPCFNNHLIIFQFAWIEIGVFKYSGRN